MSRSSTKLRGTFTAARICSPIAQVTASWLRDAPGSADAAQPPIFLAAAFASREAVEALLRAGASAEDTSERGGQ